MNRPVDRDERTLAVENSSYRWSYLTLSFGLLAISAARSMLRHEAPWDLLLLVIVGGGVNAVYQARHRVLSPRWARVALATVGLAVLIAMALVAFQR